MTSAVVSGDFWHAWSQTRSLCWTRLTCHSICSSWAACWGNSRAICQSCQVNFHKLTFCLFSRYIMSFSDRIKILRRQELDAFIVTAFAPELMNAQYLQDLQVRFYQLWKYNKYWVNVSGSNDINLVLSCNWWHHEASSWLRSSWLG